jgi:hypothetical protein
VLEKAAETDLVLDIRIGAEDRLYGKEWTRFLSRCKGVLGVESGVSIFDLDDRVMQRYRELIAKGAEVTLEDLTDARPLEENVFYRTISPRHFEAATMRNCQILFEGRYSGAMDPMVHYIPLRKDFSNFDEVVSRFRDPQVRRELTENAHRDLVASGQYTYERFVDRFDQDLIEAGLEPVAGPDAALARRAVNRGRRWRALKVQLRWLVPRRAIDYVLGNLFKVTGFVRRLAGTRLGLRRG